MSKRSLIGAAAGGALVLAVLTVHEAATYHGNMLPPTAVPVARALGIFPVEASWVKSGTPNFRGAETARSPDGKSSTGLWACDGPTTFEWQFGSDETVHLLEGQVEVDYRGRHFTLNPGDTATFHAGTRAVWHVPQYARKVFVLNQPGALVRVWRRLFPAA